MSLMTKLTDEVLEKGREAHEERLRFLDELDHFSCRARPRMTIERWKVVSYAIWINGTNTTQKSWERMVTSGVSFNRIVTVHKAVRRLLVRYGMKMGNIRWGKDISLHCFLDFPFSNDFDNVNEKQLAFLEEFNIPII